MIIKESIKNLIFNINKIKKLTLNTLNNDKNAIKLLNLSMQVTIS